MMGSDMSPRAPGALGLDVDDYVANIDDSILDELDEWPQPLEAKTLLAMLELVSSERKFVEQLERLVTRYLPMLPQVFPPTSVSLLTRNAPALLELHTRLAQQLRDNQHSRPGLCQALVAHAFELTSLHSEYCAGHSAAKSVLNRAQARHPQLWATWEKERADECPPEEDGSRPRSLEDLLIAPVQRVCRYHLLVASLRGGDDDDVNKALDAMHRVASAVDDIARVRQDEDRAKIVVERMDPIPNKDPGFLATLGPCILIGTVDMIYYSVSKAHLPSPPPSAVPFPSPSHPLLAHPKPPKAKHLAAFLWPGYLVLCKVHTSKRARYEPKHWFPLKIVPRAHVIDSGVSDCDPSDATSSPDASPWFAEAALPDTTPRKHTRSKSVPPTPHPDTSSSDTTATLNSVASSSTLVPTHGPGHVDVVASDELFPYGIRITFSRHVFELGASCAEEQELWVKAISSARVGDQRARSKSRERERSVRREKSLERGALREKSLERGVRREKSLDRSVRREKSLERGALQPARPIDIDRPRLVAEPDRMRESDRRMDLDRPRLVTDLDRRPELDRRLPDPDRQRTALESDRQRTIMDSDRQRAIMEADRQRPLPELPREDKPRREKSRERGVLTVVQPSSDGPKQIGNWMVQVLTPSAPPLTSNPSTLSNSSTLSATTSTSNATSSSNTSSSSVSNASTPTLTTTGSTPTLSASASAPVSTHNTPAPAHAIPAPAGNLASRFEDMWFQNKAEREAGRDRYGHGYGYMAANQAYPSHAHGPTHTQHGPAYQSHAQHSHSHSQSHAAPAYGIGANGQVFTPSTAPSAYGRMSSYASSSAASSTYAPSTVVPASYASAVVPGYNPYGPSTTAPSSYAPSSYSASTVVPGYAPSHNAPSTYAPSTAPSTITPSYGLSSSVPSSSATTPSSYGPHSSTYSVPNAAHSTTTVNAGRTLGAGATVARTNSSSSRSSPPSPIATAQPLPQALQVQTQLEQKIQQLENKPIVRRPSSNARAPIVLALADVISSNCREARDRAGMKRKPLWMTPEEAKAEAEAKAKAANASGGVMGMVRPRRMSSALVSGKSLLDSLPGDRKDKTDKDKKKVAAAAVAVRPSSSEGVIEVPNKTPLQRKRATIHGAMHAFPSMDAPPSPGPRESSSQSAHGHSQVQVVAPSGQVVARTHEAQVARAHEAQVIARTHEGPISPPRSTPPRSRTVSSSGSFADGMREFLMLRRTYTKSAENVAAVQAAQAEAPTPVYAVGAGLTNTRSEGELVRAKSKGSPTPNDDELYSLGAGITNTTIPKRKHKTSLRGAVGALAAMTKRRPRSGQAPLSALTFTPLPEKEQAEPARSQTARSRSNEWYHPVPAVRGAPNRGMLGAELYSPPTFRVQPSPVAEEGRFADFGDEVYDEERY